MKSRIMRRSVASLFVVAAVATACSSDETSSTETTAAPTSSAAPETTEAAATDTTFATPTGEPVKIGTTIWEFEMAGLNVKLPGIEAAVRRVNATGGIQGRPLEWVYCGGIDNLQGEQCARDMIDKGVVATVGDANLFAEVTATQIQSDAGIPMIEPFVNSPEALNDPLVYSVCPPTNMEYAAIPAAMKAAGYTKYFYLAGSSGSAQNNVVSTEGAAAFYGGLEKVGETQLPMTAADVLPQVQTAADAGADVNIAIIPPNVSTLLLEGAAQLGVQLPFGAQFGQFTAAQRSEYADVLDGSIFVSCTPPPGHLDGYPLIQQAYDDIQAYYEETGDELANPDTLSHLAIQSYLGVMAFAAAARTLDTIDAASLAAALDSTTEGFDVGLRSPWMPSQKGPAPYPAVSNGEIYLIQFKDGELTLLGEDPIDALAPFR